MKMATGTRFTPGTRNHNAVGEVWSLIPAENLEGTSIHCQPVAGGKKLAICICVSSLISTPSRAKVAS